MVYGFDPNNDPSLDYAKKKYAMGNPNNGMQQSSQTSSAPSYNDTGGSASFTPDWDPSPQNKMQFDDANYDSHYEAPPKSPMEELLDKIHQTYSPGAGGLSNGMPKLDYSPLDTALAGKLKLIEDLKNQTNQNFDKSDLNLQNMHQAFQNDINTNGAANINKFSDQQVANQNAGRDSGIKILQDQKNADMAERTAMLKNLGIQASGAAEDPNAAALNQGIASITSRGDANSDQAAQARNSNLALNQGMAQAIGNQGMERRQALNLQLQGLLGKLNGSEVDAKSQDAAARLAYQQQQQNIALQQGQQDYGRWSDEKARETAEFDKMLQQQNLQRQYAMQKIPGFAGLGQDLVRYGGADDASATAAVNVLSKIIASNPTTNMGQNEAGVIAQQMSDPNGPYKDAHIDPRIAAELASNYVKMKTPSAGYANGGLSY